ncbi:MAG: Holliday junction resolvase RuvX [Clostridia bacterium]|nr:Holliday junction resolvase RuvX [Clostridia bacterium]MBR2070326.1 Holliday junction resolvase RuvX [Clostridia bacterium]MBR2160507.1 Holliday junction resolvase RuvX [Clostridia bacterium]MBR2323781.1 Holliday junction resolvase RuvX [Clostridia bacterium]MBR2397948.1 Holliday junction resolvase RuvX [Clostridia bacterium]
MKRIIGLDVGDVRIGIASSDLLRIIASPLETYKRKGDDRDFEYIANLVKEKDADTIVCGLPYSMDGTESEQTKKTRDFAEKLQTYTDAKIVFVDERLSSWAAEQMLLDDDMSRKNRKQVIDKVAASIILETYMQKI